MSLKTRLALACLGVGLPALAAAHFLSSPAMVALILACLAVGAATFYRCVVRPVERLVRLLRKARKAGGVRGAEDGGKDELRTLVLSLAQIARSQRGYRRAVFSALKSVQRANSRLRVSQYLAQKALSMEDEKEFWGLLTEHLTLFFSCDRATVYHRESEEWLVSRVAQGISAPVKVRINEGLAGRVAQTQKSAICNEPARDPDFSATADEVTGYKTQSLLAYPLVYQGKTLGVVELLNKPGGFQEYDSEVMQDIGPQVAMFLVKFNAEERQRELTRQMMQVEKMAAVGRLAAGVAHEINNPLSAIMGFTQLLMRQLKDQAGPSEDLGKIDSESRRIRTIVQNLLGFSRASPSAFSTVRFPDLITASLALVQHELKHKPIEIITDFADDAPGILGDSNSLKQVFINLIMNAAHAMDKGPGKLVFTVRAGQDGKSAAIDVSDTGPGIPPEIQSKIFEPFFTTKPVGKGTGLGLYVVLGIVESHRGKITVASRPGEGTTFKLVFPTQAP